MNNPFEDIGLIVMEPAMVHQSHQDSNMIDVDDISDSIEQITDSIFTSEDDFVNIISIGDMTVHLSSKFLQSIPRGKYSLTLMNPTINYSMHPICGKFKYGAPILFLHDGINFDYDSMKIRIMSTIMHMKSRPIYVSLFRDDISDYHIVDKKVKSFHGFGRNSTDKTDEPFVLTFDQI